MPLNTAKSDLICCWSVTKYWCWLCTGNMRLILKEATAAGSSWNVRLSGPTDFFWHPQQKSDMAIKSRKVMEENIFSTWLILSLRDDWVCSNGEGLLCAGLPRFVSVDIILLIRRKIDNYSTEYRNYISQPCWSCLCCWRDEMYKEIYIFCTACGIWYF